MYDFLNQSQMSQTKWRLFLKVKFCVIGFLYLLCEFKNHIYVYQLFSANLNKIIFLLLFLLATVIKYIRSCIIKFHNGPLKKKKGTGLFYWNLVTIPFKIIPFGTYIVISLLLPCHKSTVEVFLPEGHPVPLSILFGFQLQCQSESFILRSKVKSQGTRSGEYRGYGMTLLSFSIKNCTILREVWAGELCYRSQMQMCHSFGFFLFFASLLFSTTSKPHRKKVRICHTVRRVRFSANDALDLKKNYELAFCCTPDSLHFLL